MLVNEKVGVSELDTLSMLTVVWKSIGLSLFWIKEVLESHS